MNGQIVMFETADTITIILMALLFAGTLTTSIGAYRRSSSRASLGRAALSAVGLCAYLLVLLSVDVGGREQWLLRAVLAGYVLPDFLFNLDVLRNHYHD